MPSPCNGATHRPQSEIQVASYKTGPPPGKINLISCEPMAHVSDIKLIRTDTTLDLSQKAEKGMLSTLSCLFLYSLHLLFCFAAQVSWDLKDRCNLGAIVDYMKHTTTRKYKKTAKAKANIMNRAIPNPAHRILLMFPNFIHAKVQVSWFLDERAMREAGFTEQRTPLGLDSGGITALYEAGFTEQRTPLGLDSGGITGWPALPTHTKPGLPYSMNHHFLSLNDIEKTAKWRKSGKGGVRATIEELLPR
ncbi:hypothetical protein VNO77_23780 [Canavalia gladiata]|uniref:Uncharacterized protein n=1 Tax=Canavalia gladiata TaxID=3824 RepID=A0AAN9L517_CANGL